MNAYNIAEIKNCVIIHHYTDMPELKKLFLASYICYVQKPSKAYKVEVNDISKASKDAKKDKALKLCIDAINSKQDYIIDNTPVSSAEVSNGFSDHAVFRINDKLCIVLIREHK